MYKNHDTVSSYEELERAVHAALETYSNVHRGSGHNSMVSTYLYEQARDIVVEYLGLKKGKHLVIFCSPRGAETIQANLKPESYNCLSSQDIGLPLGVRAIIVQRKALPAHIPFMTGGGTARLVSPGWVIWARGADRFEAGTPAIVNVIAFAKALQIIKKSGNDAFHIATEDKRTGEGILYRDELDKYSGKELLDKLKETMIGKGKHVPTADGARPFINLDNSASTPTFTPIWNAACQTMHQPLQIQQDIIREVRSVCAKTLGAPLDSYDIIFKSNTTESINLAAESFSRESKQEMEPVVLSTILEHSSNDLPWRMVPGSSMIRLSVDNEGYIDLNELEAVLSDYNQKGLHGNKRIRLMAVSGASNVMGSFNDLEAISRIVHKYDAKLLVDAAQLVAHRKIDMQQCGIDYLAFSAHKVYAPFGTGVLVARKGLLNFNTMELEQIRSSGEENASGIAALGKALILLNRIGMDKIQEEENILTRRLLNGMSQIAGLNIYGIKDPDSISFSKKGGVIVFAFNGIMSNKLAQMLAERGGIGVRAGCHCAHIMIKHLVGVPPALQKFQGLIVTLFPKLSLPGLARVSIGIGNTEKDIDTFIEVLTLISGTTRASAGSKSGAANNHKTLLSQTEIKQQINDFISTAAQRVYSN
jgi:selenocysteine lyase/cysteine desulfurase